MTTAMTHDLRAMLPERSDAFTNASTSWALREGDVDGLLSVANAGRLRAQRNPLEGPLNEILVTAELTDYGPVGETIVSAAITAVLTLAQAQTIAESREVFVHGDDELREALQR